uniref:Uncharacterized protein n=1 Tax=Plectus sambesii TaxID=2011161 RepID=A0A914VVW2_9BILA
VDEVLFKLTPAVARDPDRSRSASAAAQSGHVTGTEGLHIGDLPVFSRDAIRRMSNEVDDALSDDDDRIDEGEDEDGRPIVPQDDQDSSSSESLTSDVPRGWKRKSSDLALDQDLSENIKVPKLDGAGDNDESDDSDSNQDDQNRPSDDDDDEMAEALEREMHDEDV